MSNFSPNFSKDQNLKIKTSHFRSAKKKQKISRMPIITCECGEQILVVPDLAEMTKAIKHHINEHKEPNEEFLTEEIIKAIAK